MTRTSLFLIVLVSLQPRPAASQNTERLYQEACDDGNLMACNVFGLMNEAGDGVPRDAARALTFYQRACEGGLLVGCTNLGLMYETGTGVPQDLALAVGLYQVACEGGELLGCAGVGAVKPSRSDTLAAQFFKSGRIGDTETGEPLGDAIIDVPALEIQTTSDASGRFALAGFLPSGRYPLTVERAGYDELEGELLVPGDPEFLVLMKRADLDDPSAQGELSGRITEEGGTRGLSAVDVTVLGQTETRTLSNGRGRFNVRGLEPGLAEVRFTRLGYAPRTATLIVHPGRTVEVSATMFARPIELEPISVTVRSFILEQNGFFRRAESGRGTQYTRENIDAIDPMLASDVVRRIAGLRLEFDPTDPNRVIAQNRRGTSFTRGPCNVPVYIDDVLTFDPDLNQIPPDQIEAMEIYHGIGTPLRYSRDSCGAILIWTKRGR